MDKERRFSGVAQAYGVVGLARLRAARVAVIGVGGVGSWAVEALARSGVGSLTLIDMDHVSESNINRQLTALETTLGRAKIEILAERVAGINPSCEVALIDEFITAENLPRHLAAGRQDLVLDCIDSARVKAALLAHCVRLDLPVVSVGGAGGQVDPSAIRYADLARTEQDPLLARTRRHLRADFGFSREPRRRFGIPAVYSLEPAQRAEACGRADLNCGGLGSVMTVTASMGLFAVAKGLELLTRSRETPG